MLAARAKFHLRGKPPRANRSRRLAIRRKCESMDIHVTTVETPGASVFSAKVKAALNRAIVGEGKLSPELLSIDGMSGKKYRMLINNLIESIGDARYLEIGVWQGSTFCSAINKNKVRALAIDNWTQFGGPCDRFYNHLALFKGPEAKVGSGSVSNVTACGPGLRLFNC
jgi:hypothetical protein